MATDKAARRPRDEAIAVISMVILLAMSSGAIDVVAFLRYKVFVANQTGNLVIISLGVAEDDSSSTVMPSLVSLASFVGAIIVVVWLRQVQIRRGHEEYVVRRTALVAGAALLTVAAVLILFQVDFEVRYGVIAVLATSQGIQAVVLTRVLGVAVQTVAINGALLNTVNLAFSGRRLGSMVAAATPIGYAIGAGVGAALQLIASAFALFFAAALGIIAVFVGQRYRRLDQEESDATGADRPPKSGR